MEKIEVPFKNASPPVKVFSQPEAFSAEVAGRVNSTSRL